ncbi:MAG: FkbM family methyltransferase, partial [Methylococcales bacterium]
MSTRLGHRLLTIDDHSVSYGIEKKKNSIMDPIPPYRTRFRMALVKGFDRLCRMKRWRTLERIMTQAVEKRNELFFVQIGANDGIIYDPIYPFVQQSKWRGVLVEPVRIYFDRLKENYRGDDRFSFENIAISDRKEIRDFYRVQENIAFLPEWVHGLGTFDPEVLMTHKWAIPDLERYVVKEKIECISFRDLIEKYQIGKIDLLLVDTEGYDYEILQQIDFERMAPGILLYEHQY